jgi:hypothetical protein
MRQARVRSLVEAVTNVVVGYGVAVGIQILVFPVFGVIVNLAQNLAIGLVFTTVSIVRSYFLRRLFEALRGEASARHAGTCCVAGETAQPGRQRSGCEPSAAAALPTCRLQNRIGSHPASMTTPHLLATTLLAALLIVPGCSPRYAHREGVGVDKEPGTSTGVTVFGDARLGVAVN